MPEPRAARTVRWSRSALRGKAGEAVRLTKFLAYHHAPDGTQAVRDAARRTLDHAVSLGFPALLERQEEEVARFWKGADVEVEGDSAMQQVVRWNLFQLMQASVRVHGHGIGARGLTGRSYEGHYFWDTEIYVLPFLIYTAPDVARAVLKFPPRHAAPGPGTRDRVGTSRRDLPLADESTATRPRPTTPQAPRSTTSTPTSPTRSGSTSRSPATTSSWPATAPRSWSRRRGSGSTSASSPSVATGGSASTP